MAPMDLAVNEFLFEFLLEFRLSRGQPGVQQDCRAEIRYLRTKADGAMSYK